MWMECRDMYKPVRVESETSSQSQLPLCCFGRNMSYSPLIYVWFTVIWKWCSKCSDMPQKNVWGWTQSQSIILNLWLHFHKAEVMRCMSILFHLSASLHSNISSWISLWWLINDAIVKQQNFSTNLDYLRCYPEISYIIHLKITLHSYPSFYAFPPSPHFLLQSEVELQGASEVGEPARSDLKEQTGVVCKRPAVSGDGHQHRGHQSCQSAEKLELQRPHTFQTVAPP